MEGRIVVGFFLQREQLDLTNSILCGETTLINESSKQYAFKVWDTQTSSFSFKPWLSFWYWDCGMQLREQPCFLEKSISIINRHNVLIITIDNGKNAELLHFSIINSNESCCINRARISSMSHSGTNSTEQFAISKWWVYCSELSSV